MNEKLTKKLHEAAPTIYPEDFGFECQEGWFDILLRAGIALHQLNLKNNWEYPISASQVKEKFGTLSLYTNPTSCSYEVFASIIREAAHQSMVTCEKCGQPGKLRRSGWLKTLCGKCALEASKITQKEFEKETLTN